MTDQPQSPTRTPAEVREQLMNFACLSRGKNRCENCHVAAEREGLELCAKEMRRYSFTWAALFCCWKQITRSRSFERLICVLPEVCGPCFKNSNQVRF